MGDSLTWTNDKRRLRELVAWAGNPRQIRQAEAQRLAESLDQFGQIQPIAIDPANEILDGHQRQRVWAALDRYGPDYAVDVRVASRPLSEKERQKLAIYLHSGATGEWDWQVLAAWEVPELQSWGFDKALLAQWNDDAANLALMLEAEQGETAEDAPLATYVPDALFPSDNDWGIPSLDSELQATMVDLPVSLWGASTRRVRMPGTWLFYCDDYRFEALWRDPSEVVNTRCMNAVEPNFTVGPQTPRAVALWHIYRKRWMARWWQNYGIRIFVDMNVDTTTFGDVMLLGVPEGWKAYATRGYSERMDFTVLEYELAKQHAGVEPLFLVYGGGMAVKALAQDRGWVWISEHMDQKHGGEVLNG